MAQPIPCTACGEGDSSWLLTARDELTGMEPGTTMGFCADCWPQVTVSLADSYGAAAPPTEPEAAGEPEPEIVAEEATERPSAEPARPAGRGRRTSSPPPSATAGAVAGVTPGPAAS